MFSLTEKFINTDLDKINLITLTYYTSKSDIINVYDTKFEFNENIVPLLTSVLETQPHIVHAKKYSNINSDSIITIDTNSEYRSFPNKSNLSFPSFFHDMKNIDNLQHIQCYNKDLINSIDINNDMIVRMYNLKLQKGEFGKYILNEEELLIIIWDWEYANLQIIINKDKLQLCTMQMNIYITEDNTLISSKVENINKYIINIDKIKNEIWK